jgi:hypothetical protein
MTGHPFALRGVEIGLLTTPRLEDLASKVDRYRAFRALAAPGEG